MFRNAVHARRCGSSSMAETNFIFTHDPAAQDPEIGSIRTA
jgi:hypothetical protein